MGGAAEAAPDGTWSCGRPGCTAPTAAASRARSPASPASEAALDVVDDQVGQPTWTRDVAELVVRLVQADAPAGTWHATSAGETSWYGFAQEVVAAAGLSPRSSGPPTRPRSGATAPRPAYTVLGHDRLVEHGLDADRDWHERWAVAASDVLGIDQPE